MAQGDKLGYFVSISNLKGGVGKTTTTTLVASYLNAYSKFSICVVDVDPQLSITQKRNREVNLYEKDKEGELGIAVKALRNLGKDIFDIQTFDLFHDDDGRELKGDELEKHKVKKLNELREFKKVASEHYDLVFFDFPGYTEDRAYSEILKLMDFIFVPFYVDELTIDATKQYVNTLVKTHQDVGFPKGIALFLFKFSLVKNTKKFLEWEAFFKKKLYVFENRIYDSVEYEHSPSTMTPFDLKGAKSIRPFCSEMMEYIKNKTN